MDIIEKAKRGLSNGFENFLKKNYDEEDAEPQVIESKPIVDEIKVERSIVEEEPEVRPIDLSQITWYILRYKHLKGGARIALVVIKHGSIKREYTALEWLKLRNNEPSLACFIAAVVSAVKPESGFEQRVLEEIEWS